MSLTWRKLGTHPSQFVFAKLSWREGALSASSASQIYFYKATCKESRGRWRACTSAATLRTSFLHCQTGKLTEKRFGQFTQRSESLRAEEWPLMVGGATPWPGWQPRPQLPAPASVAATQVSGAPFHPFGSTTAACTLFPCAPSSGAAISSRCNHSNPAARHLPQCLSGSRRALSLTFRHS